MAIDAETTLPSPQARRSYGGGWATFGLMLLVVTCVFWYRSRERMDGVAIFASEGKVGGVVSFRGQLLFVFSNVDLGPERAWTAQTFSALRDDGMELRALLTDGVTLSGGGLFGGGRAPPVHPPVLSQRWGFLVAQHSVDAFDLPGKWCRVMGVPHWILLPPGLWLVGRWVVRRGRAWRRRRRGWCLNCGYDLRTAAGVCPECGVGNVAINA